MSGEPSSEKGARYKQAPASSSRGAGDKKIIVVFALGEVYIYIPAELSAAGFELKIAGSVQLTDKSDQFYLSWSPSDLTQQDVASLYSSQTDTWTVIDEFVEAPVVIDAQELNYPDKDYQGGNLELPDSILPPPPPVSPTRNSQTGSKDREAELGESFLEINSGGVAFNKSKGESKGSGPQAAAGGAKAVTVEEHGRTEAVNFALSDLRSVKEVSKGKRSLTFFLKDGVQLPTLYFHDGGTSGLIQALQRYIYLERDPAIPAFYNVRDFNKSKRVDSGSTKPPKQDSSDTAEPPQFKTITPQNYRGARASDVNNLIQGVVGNFVGITRAVRQHLLPEKQLLEVRPGTEEDEDIDERLQTYVLSDVKASPSPKSPSFPPPSDQDHAPSAKETKAPSSAAKVLDPEASLITDYQLITDIKGKLPPRPVLEQRQPEVTSDEWERLRDDWGRITPKMEQQFRARVFAGGISSHLRKEAWKYLLNYYPFEVTDIERMELREEKERVYWVMKQQWQSFTPDQESRFHRWKELKHLINKDVLRTDREYPTYKSLTDPKIQQLEDVLRTYTMYNFDLGYVQGMSDLLAPLLVVMDNEVDAFWCFVGFMDMVEHHFEMSQEGMRNRLKQLRALLNITDPELYQFLKDKQSNNLYFCFRWLIVNFKREFQYEDIMSLWEVLWTGYLSPDFALFIALAILRQQRETLLHESYDFSDILQHINSLAKQLSLTPILELAESLCYQLGSSPCLPDDLQALIHRPLPQRVPLSVLPQVEHDTVICSPDSRAVPTTQS